MRKERIEVKRWRSDRGMNTLEYAMLAFVGAAFVAALVAVVSSDTVRGALEGVIIRALS